ncbi:TPA: hypothetical protein RNS88_003094 [Stenotrophomonas maltophilia]|uniref:hypothetical protein n=1 Tax=Pseudomonas putida TaxID=303 RepID=UPI002363B43B|nr:hypothetical protein [Pseudomonas putida]MDD2057910.1 hypothetical protein [Pseudomonas putida]HDX0923175.1 hypothetical protein [Stenotrophomonas maltophilia]
MTQVNTVPTLTNEKILQGAILNGVINAVINGAIQLYFLWGTTTIPLSVDTITNESHTVLGSAVPLAVSLAMILTVVAYMTMKVPKQPFFPSVLWLTFKHGMFVFGLCVTGAVIWQRTMGTMTVSLASAVIVLGILAGLVAGIVNYMTIHASRL